MNAKRVRAAEGVIFAAQKTKLTAAGIAASLEAACMLQSPESAAELVELHHELDGARLSLWEDGQEKMRLLLALTSAQRGRRRLRARIAKLEAEATALHALVARLGARAEQRHLVDPLDHVLEHLADERPKSCGCGHTFDAHCRDGCVAPAYHSGLLGLCGCTAEVTA